MSDIGPRRTLDLRQPQSGQPIVAQPLAQPIPASQPVPAPRPVQPRPVQPATMAQPAQAPAEKRAKQRKSGGWRVAMQFVIGLLVIIGVAAAIVALYVKYYQ